MTELSLPESYAARVEARRTELQARYDAAAALTGARELALARRLLDRIGTSDWRGEGYASPEGQRNLSIEFHWGHNHRFADGLAVTGRMTDRHIRLAAEFIEGFGLGSDHFAGDTVLDVGCWTGGTTLTLKVLGAGRIRALEEVRKYADAAQVLTRDVYGHDDVTCTPLSLYDLKDGRFDHVYIPGVVYHLSDPVLGLRRLYNRLAEGGDILVESAGIEDPRPMCWFRGNPSARRQLQRGGWAWFWPSASCLAAWLQEAGFDDIRVFWSPVSKRVYGHAVRHGFRNITRAGLSVPDIE